MGPIGKVCYAICLLTCLIVGFCGSIVLSIMIKRKLFSQTGWRVKAVLMAYPSFIFPFCLSCALVASGYLSMNYAYDAFMCIASAWMCTHWQVTVYYLKTAFLLQVSFTDQGLYKSRTKIMIFIEVVGYTTVAMYLSIYFICLRKLIESNDMVLWAIYDTFAAWMTTLMAFVFSLAMNHIKGQIKQLN